MGSGFKNFVAGAKLLESDLDGYLMRQTVMTFATAAARDSALSGVLDEGMYAYLEDSPKRLTYYDGSNWQTCLSEWATWTPSYANLTTTSGTVIAKYRYAGMRTVHAKWRLTLGASSGVGTAPTISLPVAAIDTVEVESSRCTLHDATGQRHSGVCYATGTSVGLLFESVVSAVVRSDVVSATAPFTWTTSDALSFSIIYEV